MKQVYILFLSLLSSFVAVAQNNFKPGYIITNMNDSIIGLIDFRTDEANSQVCNFKENEKAPVKSYYPGDIAKYRFINEGKYYVSHSITIDNQTYKVFLEFLISGMMNLYYHKSPFSGQEYYFFENEKQEMIPITKKPDEIVNMRIVNDLQYIGILSYLFYNYPTIIEDINSTFFNKGSMVKIVKKYHALTCTTGEECIDFENDYKRQYIKFKFSLYGGFRINKYTFKDEELIIFGSTSSLFPMIGGQINISSPRLTNLINLIIDFSLSGIKGEKDLAHDELIEYKKYKFNALSTTERVNLMLTYPFGKFSPVIEAGISHYALFNRSSSYYFELQSGVLNIIDKVNYLLPNSFSIGFNCGTGFDYLIANDHFLFCRLSFEKVSNINIISSIQFKLGITF